jgi:hypothetical protein
MDEETPQRQLGPHSDRPRWRIIQMVPLPTAAQPAPSSPPDTPPAASAAAPPPPAPTTPQATPGARAPASRPLWGDLDALLAQGPVSQPMAADALLAEAAKRRATRRRRRLLRRLRRMALAALVGAALGAGLWWWGQAWLPHPPPVHIGASVSWAQLPYQPLG